MFVGNLMRIYLMDIIILMMKINLRKLEILKLLMGMIKMKRKLN